MSFAYDVKAELCRVPINRSCCAVAEGCGVLLYASAFTANEVRIVTENDEFAARLPKLFQKNAQVLVKLLDFFAVAFHISSVSPQGIEINQVHKAKSPEILFADLDGLLHAVYGAV